MGARRYGISFQMVSSMRYIMNEIYMYYLVYYKDIMETTFLPNISEDYLSTYLSIYYPKIVQRPHEGFRTM